MQWISARSHTIYEYEEGQLKLLESPAAFKWEILSQEGTEQASAVALCRCRYAISQKPATDTLHDIPGGKCLPGGEFWLMAIPHRNPFQQSSPWWASHTSAQQSQQDSGRRAPGARRCTGRHSGTHSYHMGLSGAEPSAEEFHRKVHCRKLSEGKAASFIPNFCMEENVFRCWRYNTIVV